MVDKIKDALDKFGMLAIILVAISAPVIAITVAKADTATANEKIDRALMLIEKQRGESGVTRRELEFIKGSMSAKIDGNTRMLERMLEFISNIERAD